MLALHWLQPQLSPWSEAMSYYVHGPHGWLLTVSLVGLGLGSAALTCGVWQAVSGHEARAGRWCLVAWSAGVILGSVFAADPLGNWNQPPSVAGSIHGFAAVVALTILPLAGFLLSRSFRADPRWHHLSGWSLTLSGVSALGWLAFLLSLVPVMVRPGPPVLLGLTERILMAAEVAWLTIVAVGLLRRPQGTVG